MKSLGKICRKDIHGSELQEGDIIAAGKVGELIWEGKATLLSRPIGIVYIPEYHPPYNKDYCFVEETDCYNVMQIRPGEVAITKDADKYIKNNLCNGTGKCFIHLDIYDGCFYGWNTVEKIGSIYDFK